MRPLRWLLGAALLGALTPAAAIAAKPHVTGAYAFPHGLWPGGFVQHGTVDGPGNTVWMTTEPATGSKSKPVLLRIAPTGRETGIKIPVGGGMSFSGVGLGPNGLIWFSGTEAGGSRRGVSGSVSGTTAHFAIAKDSSSWDQLAVLNGTAYMTTGFNQLLTSSNGTTFGTVSLENVSPFDITVFGGGLALAGDGAIGLLSSSSIAPRTAAGTLVTVASGVVPSSRHVTVAGGKLWFLQESEGGGGGIGSAAADGTATVTPFSGARGITTGPDGAPWVLTNTGIVRIGPTGTATATVKLPHRLSGILIAGAASKYIWVGALDRAKGTAKLIRIAV